MRVYFKKKISRERLFFALLLAALAFLASCAASPGSRKTGPIRPEKPQRPEKILGKGLTGGEILASFLLELNPSLAKNDAQTLAGLYIEESAIEGVNHDVAFAQMCLETGYLRFGGLVTRDMNNFCGLGSIGAGQNGASFPSARIGVRAHIQHLKGYATDAPLKQPLVDPRYRYVKYGSAPDIYGLAGPGRWAADKEYGRKIAGILEKLYAFAYP